jgi:uncharacterized protein
MRIIDGHGHLGTMIKLYSLRVTDMESTIREMDRCRVEKMVISHLNAISYDFKEGNGELKKAVDQFTDRIIPFFAVHPRFWGTAAEEIKRCAGEWGWRGLKLHPDFHAYPANCVSVVDTIGQAQAYQCVVMIHSADRASSCYATPAMIADVARQLPDTKIIIAHMGMADWQEAIEWAEQYPNLILDSTGSLNWYGMIESAVEKLGVERVIWGSDFPLFPLEMGISKIVDSDIDEESKRQILGENIKRIMQIA